jgi:hypothetical protein
VRCIFNFSSSNGPSNDVLTFIHMPQRMSPPLSNDLVFDIMIAADWPDRTRIPEVFSAVLYFAHSTAAQP